MAETKGRIAVLEKVSEAAPNKIFTEEQRATVRFLRYSVAVTCGECGKRKRTHWTMLCSFSALSFGASFVRLDESGKVHLPLAPVCRDHLLAPAEVPHG